MAMETDGVAIDVLVGFSESIGSMPLACCFNQLRRRSAPAAFAAGALGRLARTPPAAPRAA